MYEVDTGVRITMVYDGIVDMGERQSHWLDADVATPFPLPVITALDAETGGHPYYENSQADQHPTITLPLMEWDRPPGRHSESIGRYDYEVEIEKAGNLYSVGILIRWNNGLLDGQPSQRVALSYEHGQLMPEWV